MREVFPVRGKVREFYNFTTKSWKSQGIFCWSGKIQGKLNQKIKLFMGKVLRTVVFRHSSVEDKLHVGKIKLIISEYWG